MSDGETERTESADLTQSELSRAAREGRVSVRASNLAPQILEALAKKFGPDYIVGKFEECLGATKTIAIGGRPYETTDFKTRLDALRTLVQYQVGMPVARSEVITHNVDTMQTLESKMQSSPALRRAIGRMLDKSKSEEGEVVDVTSQSSDQDAVDAEKALQEVARNPETPIQEEIRIRSMKDVLTVKGGGSIEEKYSR